MSLSHQERVTVVVGGRDLGVWSTFAGGENDADNQIDHPGGMAQQETYGGLATRGDITVTRVYKLERDHPLVKFLDQQAGIGRCVVTRTMLSPDRTPSGDPIGFTGVLKTFTHPDSDSNSSDKKMVSLTITADGPIT